MLQENRIHVFYIEWSGDRKVVEILANHGYQTYDSTYVVCPKAYDAGPFEEIGFHCIDEINLSTGKVAYEMILVDDSISPAEALNEVRKRNLAWWIQTDLIAISEDTKDRFLMAVEKFSETANSEHL